MYKFLVFLIMIGISPHLVAEDQKTSTKEEKPKYTEEQLNKLHKAEEQFKDNPEMMNFINKLKDQAGLNKPPEPKAAPQKPAIEGSRSVADKAYENGDYKTALENYKALAAKGDADASLILGTMYEQGQGTEKDPALAQAWYKQAAEAGDDRGKELMNLNDKQMSDEEKANAEEKYKEINKEITQADKNENAGASGQQYKVLINPDTLQQNISYEYNGPERTVKFSPEKYVPKRDQLQIVTDHYQPDKFKRKTSDSGETIN